MEFCYIEKVTLSLTFRLKKKQYTYFILFVIPINDRILNVLKYSLLQKRLKIKLEK